METSQQHSNISGQGSQRGPFVRNCNDGIKSKGYKLKGGKFRLDTRNKCFTETLEQASTLAGLKPGWVRL